MPPSCRSLAAIGVLLASASASAQTPPPPQPSPAGGGGSPAPVPEKPVPEKPEKPVSFDFGGATEFPVMVAGASAVLEIPLRFQFRAEIGWLGTPYVEAIDGFLKGIGAYGQGQAADYTSELIRAAFHNSLVFRTGAGWRPFRKHGFEFYVGYTLVALGGSLGAKDAVTAITGKSFSNEQQRFDMAIHSTLHNFHAGLGWRWVLWDHFTIRTSVEYLQTLASKTTLSLDTRQGAVDLPDLSAATSKYLNDIYVVYVKSPVVDLSFAYRF